MSLYYFHLCDGEDVLLDPDGRNFDSLDGIPEAALMEARSIIGDDAIQGVIKLAYHINVEDASGQVVHRLEFEDAVELIRGR